MSSDAALGRRAFLFVNKAWGYGDANPDHYFLALNYRMTELQGAVAAAQLDKLAAGVARRVETAAALTEALAGLRGIATPQAPPRGVHSYWKYCLRVDPRVVPGGAPALAAALKTWGIASAPRYIQKPAFAVRCSPAGARSVPAAARSRWPGRRRSTTGRSGSPVPPRVSSGCSCCRGTSG